VKTEIVRSYEKLINAYQTIRNHIANDSTSQRHSDVTDVNVLFICDLFNDSFSVIDYSAWSDKVSE
jgi:hypothetical protein